MSLSRRRILTGAAAALTLGACSTPQTLIPYTPAAGVNNGPNAAEPHRSDDRVVAVRNLLIVTTSDGNGYLSGSLVARGEPVTLRDVAGSPIKADGTAGTALVVSGGTRLDVPANTIKVLTDQPSIQVKSPDLVAGRTAELSLTFDKGDVVRLKVPVYASTMPEFATITPKK
ncbi:MAG TPA: hypothetical protein PKM36_02580 [Propionibacteriaceae bacterium]|nr:hypothetical protein [Propionibacteriaceae bacterium]